MTREPNESLYDFIVRLLADPGNPKEPARRRRDRQLAASAVRSPADVVSALETAWASRDNEVLCFIVNMSEYDDDPGYAALVPTLCEMLDAGDGVWCAEDAVELLGDLGDPRAVPSLQRLINSSPAWDLSGYAAEKAVWSLEQIGTDEARAAIRDAMRSRRRRVWLATTRSAIEWRDPASLLYLGRRVIDEEPSTHHAEPLLRALAELRTSEAWSIIDDAARSKDDDTRVLAAELLKTRDANP
jgi:hypothetical protein